MSLFKHQWITQEIIDYLMSLPILYQILYVVRVNGNGSTSFLFRDDDGKMVANLYERDVIAVRIQYQDDPFFEDCPVGKILDKYSLPYMKKGFRGIYGTQAHNTKRRKTQGPLHDAVRPPRLH